MKKKADTLELPWLDRQVKRRPWRTEETFKAFCHWVARPHYSKFTVLDWSTEEEDRTAVADFVLDARPVMLANRCRARKAYVNGDVTFRAYRGKSGKCEIDKIREGRGDFYVYVYDDEPYSRNNPSAWLLFDLNKLRDSGYMDLAWKRYEEEGRKRGGQGQFGYVTWNELEECGALIDYCLPGWRPAHPCTAALVRNQPWQQYIARHEGAPHPADS
ncbi:MAG: hypothetical protein ACYTEQ_28825 [Planctomycetota bacterium]|jgi:hypothetical protein